MELKKGQHELLPLERSEVPDQIIEIVESNGNAITEMKRFRARNWRKKPYVGLAFATTDGRTFLIHEGCELRQYRGGFRGSYSDVPAYGITIAHSTIAEAVDAMYCHTAMRMSCVSYNVAVREETTAGK